MTKSSSSNARSNLALGGSVLASGAGTAPCLPDDKSFTCRLNNGVKNLQNMIFVLGVIYFLYYGFKNKKSLLIK